MEQTRNKIKLILKDRDIYVIYVECVGILLSKCNIFYCARSLYTTIDIHGKIRADTFNTLNATSGRFATLLNLFLSAYITSPFSAANIK